MTIGRALFFVIGSCCITAFLFFTGFHFWINSEKKRLTNDAYIIDTIIQTGPEKEALQTAYLAELLELSVDEPINLHAFDLKKGERRLLASPLIAEASLKRVAPSTLYVDYEMRRPFARLGDYSNTAIDKEGYIFPMVPFFSPKNLPEIFLGLPPFGAEEDMFGRSGGKWQERIQNGYLSLAFEILQFLEGFAWKENLKIKRVDVSNAFAASLGQREIVIFTEEELLLGRGDASICCTFPKMLRLSPKEYSQQMLNFLSLRKTMMDDYQKQLEVAQIPPSKKFSSRIIDLRIAHLAFVEN